MLKAEVQTRGADGERMGAEDQTMNYELKPGYWIQTYLTLIRSPVRVPPSRSVNAVARAAPVDQRPSTVRRLPGGPPGLGPNTLAPRLLSPLYGRRYVYLQCESSFL